MGTSHAKGDATVQIDPISSVNSELQHWRTNWYFLGVQNQEKVDFRNRQLLYIKAAADNELRLQATATAVAVASQRTYVSNGSGVERWRDLVSQYPWPVDAMLAIMNCESHGNPDAVGGPNNDGLYDYGLFQLHGDPKGLDPYYNVAVAYQKYQARGFQPWLSSASCHGYYG